MFEIDPVVVTRFSVAPEPLLNCTLSADPMEKLPELIMPVLLLWLMIELPPEIVTLPEMMFAALGSAAAGAAMKGRHETPMVKSPERRFISVLLHPNGAKGRLRIVSKLPRIFRT